MLVCIEGIDACGKNTQAQRLTEYLEGVLISFPDYSTPMGKLVMAHLKGYWEATPLPEDMNAGTFPDRDSIKLLNAEVFQSLQITNRMERMEDIKVLLDQGKNVVLDRYWPSGWVYGTADGLDRDYLLKIHSRMIQPNLFLLMDIDAEQSIERRPERRDRYEKQAGLMETAADLYRKLWIFMSSQHFKDWKIIDARPDQKTVWASIKDAVDRKRRELA